MGGDTCGGARYRQERCVAPLPVLLVIASLLLLTQSGEACICSTNTALRNALDDLRTSVSAQGWDASADPCLWSGVSCTTASGLTSLTICSSVASCGAGGQLPSSTTTWNAIGQALTSLTISNSGNKISGGFPIGASASLTLLRSFSLYYFSPAGATTLPVGSASIGLSVTFSQSNVVLTSPSTSQQVTSISVSYATVPNFSGYTKVSRITLFSATPGTLDWTGMSGLTSIAISSSTSITAWPTWTSNNLPALASIYFSSVGVSGALPDSWASFSSLTLVSISSCSGITSALPSSWSSFASLQYLYLYSTPIAGPLPGGWSSLDNLQVISIVGASFSGHSLPEAWSGLKGLTTLVISNSGLGGTVPSWSSATATLSLSTLTLSSNSLTGPLPTLPKWVRVTSIDLSSNPLSTTLPLWSTLVALTSFGCSACGIIGPLPQWGASTSPPLQIIQLSGNSIQSTIPPSWGQLASLLTFTGSSSSLVGQMPLTWVSSSLRTLQLNINNLTGPLSTLSFTGNPPNFITLHLESNSLGPACSFAVPSGLQSLQLNDNLCSGNHPTWTSATSLTMVDLSGNSFAGALAALPSSAMRTLRIDGGNTFQGSLPQWSSWSNLVEVRAGHNLLSGTIPLFSASARPTTFNISNNYISGSIPTSMNCGSIQIFDVSSNSLTGELPQTLRNANSLTSLNVSHNQLEGSLGLSTSLSSLRLLDCACNRLSGTVPSMSSSSNLMYVNLTCGNTFGGAMPNLHGGVYNSLVGLDLTDMGLTGSLYSILGSTLSGAAFSSSIKVERMLLGGNAFVGSLPKFLLWSNLISFNASGSSLSGTITSAAAFPAALRMLDLSRNALRGTIPVPSDPFLPLTQLLLGGDSQAFAAPLPSSLSTTFPNLVAFSLTGAFSGTILPYTWLVGPTAWTNLTTLSLRGCGFGGTFPGPIASVNLASLDLSRNQLNGWLPEALPDVLPLLETLDLSENGFAGVLPSSWSRLTRVTTLDVHGCNLSGEVPLAWSSLAALTTLRLHANLLESSPNDTLWTALDALQELDLSSNRLTTPPLFSNASHLAVLNVSRNLIAGHLPGSWGSTLTSLRALNASHNELIGGFPPEWMSSSLIDVDLQHNLLNGTLPQSLAHLFSSVERLQLQANAFSGTLGGSLGNALWDLDLSENSLSGQLPVPWLTDAPAALRSLKLQGNQLNSTLPKAWGSATGLGVLNLSSNMLRGPLPYTWGGILSQPALTVDLCGNQLCGPAPLQLVNLTTVGLDRCPGSLRMDVLCFTESVEVTQSATVCSKCRTPTSAPSVSTSNSAPSPTRSVSAPLTVTPSFQRSLSLLTWSISLTNGNISLSRSHTVSIAVDTLTESSSPSLTASVCATPSATEPISVSPSETTSISSSASRTGTRPSYTGTAATGNISVSVSFSFSRSRSSHSLTQPTQTVNLTFSHSTTRATGSRSRSASPSLLQTSTRTLSSTRSITRTPPTTRTKSASLNSSKTLSASRSATRTRPVSKTRTASLSLSEELRVGKYDDAFSAAVNGLTASASVLASLASSADVSNANTLILLSFLDCRSADKSPERIRDGSMSSYMISPLMDVGWVAVAWGNIALSAAVFAVNALVGVVFVLAKTRARNGVAWVLASVFRIEEEVDEDDASVVQHHTTFRHFPAFGLRFLELWLPGSVLASFFLMSAVVQSADGKELGIAAGLLALLCCLGILVSWQVFLVKKIMPITTFITYNIQVLILNPAAVPTWAPRWLLPVGTWKPPTLRCRFKQLFASQRAPWGSARIAFHFGMSCVTSLLTASSFISSLACEISCSLLASLFFAAAMFLVWNRRQGVFVLEFDTPFSIAVLTLLGVQCCLSAASLAVPTWLALIQTLLTITRMILRILSNVLEKRMRKYASFGDSLSDSKLMEGFDRYSLDGDGGSELAPRDALEACELLQDENEFEEVGDEEQDLNRVLNPIDLVVVQAVQRQDTTAPQIDAHSLPQRISGCGNLSAFASAGLNDDDENSSNALMEHRAPQSSLVDSEGLVVDGSNRVDDGQIHRDLLARARAAESQGEEESAAEKLCPS